MKRKFMEERTMLYHIPDYYREFHCTADRCEDTCCAGWQIAVDRQSLKKYKKVRGTFRSRIKKGVDFKAGTFRHQPKRRCAFLNEDNLCDMYTALGKNSLCKTCRLYPRHIEEFENVREITLSLSCPEVARILMSRSDPVTFHSVEREGEETYADFDPFFYSQLLDARDVIRKILQNRSIPLAVRSGLVYGIGHDMQLRVNRQELFSCGNALKKYQKPAAEQFVQERIRSNLQRPEKQFAFAKRKFRCLHQLELLKKDWELLLLETEQKLFLDHTALEYEKQTEEFHRWLRENEFPWEIQKEQLLVYFIDTYFCGAVYDGVIQKKVQMALFCADILEILVLMRWLRNEKQLDLEDVIELSYRFSREVEHSDLNLKRMEAMMPNNRKRESAFY